MIRNVALSLFLSFTALVSTNAVAAIDGSTLSSVKEGTSTAQEIRQTYGTPDHESHNPDGRYVYLYEIASPPPDMAGASGKAVASFLFGSDDKLIRLRFFKM